jgi:hypothetical protein
MIYYDPDGHFLKEILDARKYGFDRELAFLHAVGELAVDTVVGAGMLAWTTGEFVGSAIGLEGNEIAYQLGLTSEDTYNQLQNAYGENFLRSGQVISSLPGNMVTGVVDSFMTTINPNEIKAYLDPKANHDTLVNYSKSAIQTGATIYGTYKLIDGGINLAKNIANKSIGGSFADKMSIDDAARYNNYWDQVKQGLTAEQRYNYKLYGDIGGSTNFKINVVKDHSINQYGSPGTITRKIDSNGIIQDRIYGPDGKVLKDIDFFHNQKPGAHFFPHLHNWSLKNDQIIRTK